MVSIVALKDALFEGMDRFLINLYKNPNSKEAKLADARFQSFVDKMPTSAVMPSSGTTGLLNQRSKNPKWLIWCRFGTKNRHLSPSQLSVCCPNPLAPTTAKPFTSVGSSPRLSRYLVRWPIPIAWPKPQWQQNHRTTDGEENRVQTSRQRVGCAKESDVRPRSIPPSTIDPKTSMALA